MGQHEEIVEGDDGPLFKVGEDLFDVLLQNEAGRCDSFRQEARSELSLGGNYRKAL